MLCLNVSSNRILMVVYTLDSSHALLSSQARLVTAIANRVDRLYVIAGSVGEFACPKNVSVTSLEWAMRGLTFKTFRKLLKLVLLIRKSREIVRKHEIDTVFIHMADVFASFLALGKVIESRKIFLWYAHTTKSIWVRMCQILNISFLSSTPGSFPIQTTKVSFLGQVVKYSAFPFFGKRNSLSSLSDLRFCHVGRLDKSKNILQIISSLVALQKIEKRNISFNHFGNTTSRNRDYEHAVMREIQSLRKYEGLKIELHPNIANGLVAPILHEHDVFIHAYQGSLDKALLEATLAGIPVITVNQEYHRIFGSWSSEINQGNLFSIKEVILKEWLAISTLDSQMLNDILNRRHRLVKTHYSEENWLNNFFVAIQKEG